MQITKKILRNPFVLTIIAILCGFIVAAIILAAAGYPPLASVASLCKGIFQSPKSISNVIIKSTPIIFTGLGVAFALKTGLFNIGAEGQFIIGTVASVIVGVTLNLHPILQIPVVILSGMTAAAIYGGIIGYLKAKFGINEVITSIMFNWIALYFLDWIVSLKRFHKPSTMGSYPVNPSSFTLILGNWKKTEAGMAFLDKIPWLKSFLLKTDVNAGFTVAVICALLLSYLLYKTRKGYELRAVGFSKDAAEYTGINIKRNTIEAMVISGALCGLGAAFYITGNSPHSISQLASMENYGFNGLSVAFIASGSPVGCIFAGLLFGGLLYGGGALQYEVGAPSEIINIVIGVIVFFCALSYIIPRIVDRLNKKGEKHA